MSSSREPGPSLAHSLRQGACGSLDIRSIGRSTGKSAGSRGGGAAGGYPRLSPRDRRLFSQAIANTFKPPRPDPRQSTRAASDSNLFSRFVALPVGGRVPPEGLNAPTWSALPAVSVPATQPPGAFPHRLRRGCPALRAAHAPQAREEPSPPQGTEAPLRPLGRSARTLRANPRGEAAIGAEPRSAPAQGRTRSPVLGRLTRPAWRLRDERARSRRGPGRSAAGPRRERAL